MKVWVNKPKRRPATAVPRIQNHLPYPSKLDHPNLTATFPVSVLSPTGSREWVSHLGRRWGPRTLRGEPWRAPPF